MNKKTTFDKRENIKNFFIDNINNIFSDIFRIENIIITPEQTDELINNFLNNEIPNMKNISLDNFFMVIGIYKAYKEFFINTNMLIDEFPLSLKSLKEINGLIGQYEEPRCGNIRTHKVRLKNVSYIPPEFHDEEVVAAEFNDIIQKFEALKQTNNKNQIIDFIFQTGTTLIKEQWFPNSNNRTISFLMNSMLLNAGIGFLWIKTENIDKYKELRNNFYEDENKLNELVEFLKSNLFLEEKEFKLENKTKNNKTIEII